MNTQDTQEYVLYFTDTKIYYGAAQDQNSFGYSVAIHTDSLLLLNLDMHRLNLVIQMSLLVMINFINGGLTTITQIVNKDMLQRNRTITQNIFTTFFFNHITFTAYPLMNL